MSLALKCDFCKSFFTFNNDKYLPNKSSVFFDILNPLIINIRNKVIITIQPKNPNSSAITAKIKSVCPSGSHDSFCFEFPYPTPKKPPDANAIKD